MSNFPENMNDQIKQLLELQTRSLEPLKILAGLATDTAEQIARKNYELAGDVIEFSTKQAHLSLSGKNLGDVAAAQIAESSAFADRMGSRAGEYAELASSFSGKAREAAEAASETFK